MVKASVCRELSESWLRIESLALLLFIFFSYVTAWDAFSRFFLFFGVFPLALARLIKHRSVSDWLLLGPIVLVMVSALMNFASGASLDDSFQSMRWALSVCFFLYSVHYCARFWGENPRIWGRVLLLCVFLITTFSLAIYAGEGQYPGRLSAFGYMSHPIVGPAGLICLWGAGTTLMAMVGRHRMCDIWLWLGSTVALSVVLLLSQSRGPIISYLFFLFVLLAGATITLDTRKRLAITLSVAGIALCLVGLAISSPLLEQMVGRGVSYRLDIFHSVLQYPPSTPWIGIGSAADFTQSPAGENLQSELGLAIEHPHNLFLSTYYQSGIVVGVAFLALILGLLLRIGSTRLGRPVQVVALAWFATVLLLNTSDGAGIVIRPSGEWMFFWFPFSFLAGFFVSGQNAHSKVREDQGASLQRGTALN